MAARDRKAVDILLSTYWSSQGWREPPAVASDDLAYAKAAGLMFDSLVRRTHDELVREVVEAAASLRPADAASAFLSSLTTRQLEDRSALGSYAVARHLVEHDLVPWRPDHAGTKYRCGVCGLWNEALDIDRNVLNFERYKWGGVRRDDLTYVWLDLRQFGKLSERPVASDDDIALFRLLIGELERQPAEMSAPKAQGVLRALRSNKAEREVVLDILGVCGVLETAEHRGYAERFVPARLRELPPLRFVERVYPVCWWRGSDSVNRQALVAFGLPV